MLASAPNWSGVQWRSKMNYLSFATTSTCLSHDFLTVLSSGS